MNNEFKPKKFKDTTVYTLESATSGGTSTGGIASVSGGIGGVQRRKPGQNLIAQEGDKAKVPASKPRNFVAKNATTGGAGAHKDKKKAAKQGDVKHKARELDMAEEASPMIKPPTNRFDNKHEAFAYAREHGGKVFKSTYIDPNTGNKNINFVVKKEEGVAEGLNEFAMSGGDDDEDPFDNYPCYDCGSTIFLHHTELCELAEENAIRDLPAKPGSQHWTGQIPKGLHPIPGLQEGVAEGVPQPGPSSGAPKQFGSDAKIQTRQMTVKDIISSVPGVPYYNNVVDDWDAKDYSWGVTKKVIEYATYLKDHPESLAKLPPAIVLNGKFEDGAHRVSAIWLLQQRMDPKNPLWKNAKLNVQFVKQGVAEAKGKLTYTPEPTEYGVFPDSKNEFVKTFLSRDLALAHIKKFGGKLIVLDQHGRRMKEGVAEGSLNESVIRSETIGPYTHELHKTPWGYQVRVYAGGKQVHSDITKPTEEKGQQSFDSNIAYTKKQLRINEQGVAEGAPELLKAEMPLVRHIERELTQHGYEKGTSEYNEHFKHALAYYRKFGNIDAIKKGVAEGIQFLPIDKFPKTDDENQSELYLKTKDGNVYVGEWDSASGYFFATDIVHGNHPAGNELPGRMYNRPVAFAVKQGVAEASSPAQQAAIAIAKKKKAGVKESIAEDHSTATGGWGQGSYNTASKDTSKWAGAGHNDAVRENPEWYNDEANSMTTSQLKSLVKHAAKLRHAVKQMQAQGDTLEPWQQSKVTKAADYLDAVFNAVDDEHDMGESEDHPDEKEDKALIRKMVKQQALKQEDSYMEALSAKLGEKLKANDPVDKYINDFSKAAKTPNAKGHHQFKNKSPEKVRQMAIAASYGAKNKSKKK